MPSARAARWLSSAWIPTPARTTGVCTTYFDGTHEADLARYPTAESIRGWMMKAGFVDVTSGTAEHILHSLTGAEVLQSPFVQKGGTSQLALLTQEVYQAGLERIKADLLQAERAGRALKFRVDISLALVLGRVP